MEDASFTDLIRAREQQQRRIREALEQQNVRLRSRLTSKSEGGSAANAGAAAAASENRRYQLHRNSHYVLQKPAESTVATEEFVTFVTELKELVSQYHEADQSVLSAIQAKIELQEKETRLRMAELEAKIAATQRATSVPTGDSSPFFVGHSPCNGVDLHPGDLTGETTPVTGFARAELLTMRRDVDDALKRVQELEDDTRTSGAQLHALEKDVNLVEKRLVDVEMLPAAFRREAVGAEERFSTFADHIRDLLQQQQTPKAIEMHLAQWSAKMKEMEGAEVELRGRVEAAAAEAERNTRELGSRAGDLERAFHRQLAELRENLEDRLTAAVSEQKRRWEEMRRETDEAQQLQRAELSLEVSNTLKSALTSFHDFAEKELGDRFADFARRTAAIEEERRQNFPVLDEDRLTLMTKELEGALGMLEGVFSRAVYTAPESSAVCEDADGARMDDLAARLENMERQLLTLEEALQRGDRPAKMRYSVETQTTSRQLSDAEAGAGQGAGGSVPAADSRLVVALPTHEERLARHLSHEMELAATEQGAAAVMEATTLILDKAQQRRAVSPTSLPLTHLNGAPSFPGHAVRQQQQLLSSGSLCLRPARGADATGPFRAPKLAITTNSMSQALAELRLLKSQKEAAVSKVVQSLREVQSKFMEISAREVGSRGSIGGGDGTANGLVRGSSRSESLVRVSSGMNSDDTRRVASLIARQKEAVHAKERQLVDTRNKLWREIAQLEEDEREMLQQHRSM